MNLLAAPWSEALARALVVMWRRSLRAPIICVAASMVLVGVGNATLASRVAQSEALERTTADERVALDRAVASTHVREARLRADLMAARRIASVERNAKRMIELITHVVNRTPKSVWFEALTVDRNELSIHANADSLVAIAGMLRSTSTLLPGASARVTSIDRASDTIDPVRSFTFNIQRLRVNDRKGSHARS